MNLKSTFEKAAEEATKLPERPDNDTLLRLYSLYKQATVGDVLGDRPSAINFVRRIKYDSWAKLKGQSKEESMRSYIDLVNDLKSK